MSFESETEINCEHALVVFFYVNNNDEDATAASVMNV